MTHMPAQRRSGFRALLAVYVVMLLAIPLAGCFLSGLGAPAMAPPAGAQARVLTLETSGYDAGPESCNWRRTWYGRPVIASGPNAGRPKAVGVTASGTRARYGTIAADTNLFPYGTIIHVPGYGHGRVEDQGREIKGRKIDLFFPSRQAALDWGRQVHVVQVWLPGAR